MPYPYKSANINVDGKAKAVCELALRRREWRVGLGKEGLRSQDGSVLVKDMSRKRLCKEFYLPRYKYMSKQNSSTGYIKLSISPTGFLALLLQFT